MVPAAGALLLWALLLSLGPWAAGARGLTSTPTQTGMQRVSFRFGGPARSSRSTAAISRSGLPRKTRITLEDENDAVATADRLAGPAAAELLAATVTGTGQSRTYLSREEDESLEEGVVIDARKSTSVRTATTSLIEGKSRPTFIANSQEPEIRLSTSLPPPSRARSAGEPLDSEGNLGQWSTAGSTPSRWTLPSPTAMPAPEDLRLVLMPWGPWHCHCKSGTMSRSRAGKLQGLSGRLRVGALSQLRTEHRPCTYRQCPCNQLREECPLDSELCPDSNCASRATTRNPRTTTRTFPDIHLRRRPSLPPIPALDFWKQVRTGLEDIWNSLSTVFTEMQPVDRRQR